MTECIIHHPACRCREQQIRELIEAANDCAVELDHLKNDLVLTGADPAVLSSIILRVYAAAAKLDRSDLPHPPRRKCDCQACAPGTDAA